jgi:solute:Na+ symporter, SSS family
VVALLTIPLGIFFRVVSPELPFILRIGYVFIILVVVMVALSLRDRSHQVANPVSPEFAARSKRSGWIMIGTASLVGIGVSFFVVPMRYLALEAVYVLVAGFILIGAINVFNGSRKMMNANGIIIEPAIFKTSTAFNVAAIGICGILAMLYYFFW